jgi:hypothetical protein
VSEKFYELFEEVRNIYFASLDFVKALQGLIPRIVFHLTEEEKRAGAEALFTLCSLVARALVRKLQSPEGSEGNEREEKRASDNP